MRGSDIPDLMATYAYIAMASAGVEASRRSLMLTETAQSLDTLKAVIQVRVSNLVRQERGMKERYEERERERRRRKNEQERVLPNERVRERRRRERERQWRV